MKPITVIIVIILVVLISAAVFIFIRQRAAANRNEMYHNLVEQIKQGNEDAYREAISLFPERPIAYLEQSVQLFLQERFDECIRFTTRAISALSEYTHSNDGLLQIAEMHHIMGTVYSQLGDYQSAASAYKAALEINPLSPEITRGYLISLAFSGYVARADELLRDSLNKLPTAYTLDIVEQIANEYVNIGELEKALSLFLVMRNNGENSFITWQNIGVLYQQLEDYTTARRVFTEMIETYPNDYRPPMRLSLLVLEEQQMLANERRDYSEALEMYTVAQELNDAEDVDLMRLSGLVAELRAHGWLD
jgi:tetratricopeptide (TPR) repeat protein